MPFGGWVMEEGHRWGSRREIEKLSERERERVATALLGEAQQQSGLLGPSGSRNEAQRKESQCIGEKCEQELGRTRPCFCCPCVAVALHFSVSCSKFKCENIFAWLSSISLYCSPSAPISLPHGVNFSDTIRTYFPRPPKIKWKFGILDKVILGQKFQNPEKRNLNFQNTFSKFVS